MAPFKNSSLTTINLMNHSPKKVWTHTASHRVFNILLTAAIALSLSSQAFAQKVSMIPKKAQTAASKNQKRRASIDQQIIAQAQALSGAGKSVKIYSDDAYKRKAKKPKSTRNTVAQSAATAFGPSNRLDLDNPNDTKANISTQLSEAKKAALPENIVNGSVAITIGQDSNLDETSREDISGGFYEMKPSISYTGRMFFGSFGASIKDYSSQENSEIARKTDINAETGAKFSLTEDVSTTSKLSFLNRDFRWPDFLTGTDDGMAIRFFETKFAQSVDFKLKALTVNITGSYSNRDFTTTYSDTAPDVLGRQDFQRDLNDAELNAKFDVKFNDHLSFIAKPGLKHRKYKAEPARQTDGQKGGAALNSVTPRREILTNSLAVDLKTTLGAFTITPTATIGQDVDRALGAEDTSFSGGGISLEITIDKDLGLVLGGSANYRNTKYDNWTDRVVPAGETREIDGVDTGISAGVNLSKSVALGLDYSREEYESNLPAFTDENFTREVIGTTLTVSF
jgi:hypothetical protein